MKIILVEAHLQLHSTLSVTIVNRTKPVVSVQFEAKTVDLWYNFIGSLSILSAIAKVERFVD